MFGRRSPREKKKGGGEPAAPRPTAAPASASVPETRRPYSTGFFKRPNVVFAGRFALWELVGNLILIVFVFCWSERPTYFLELWQNHLAPLLAVELVWAMLATTIALKRPAAYQFWFSLSLAVVLGYFLLQVKPDLQKEKAGYQRLELAAGQAQTLSLPLQAGDQVEVESFSPTLFPEQLKVGFTSAPASCQFHLFKSPPQFSGLLLIPNDYTTTFGQIRFSLTPEAKTAGLWLKLVRKSPTREKAAEGLASPTVVPASTRLSLTFRRRYDLDRGESREEVFQLQPNEVSPWLELPPVYCAARDWSEDGRDYYVQKWGEEPRLNIKGLVPVDFGRVTGGPLIFRFIGGKRGSAIKMKVWRENRR